MNLDEQQDFVFLENVGLDSFVILGSFSGANNIIPRSFIIHLYTSLSRDFFHSTYRNTFPAIHNNFDLLIDCLYVILWPMLQTIWTQIRLFLWEQSDQGS